MATLNPRHEQYLYLLRLLPVLLMVVGVFFAFLALAAPNPQDASSLKAQLDLYEKQAATTADHLRSLTLVIGLFVALQGLFAFFAASQFESRARETTGRIETVATRFERQAQDHLARIDVIAEQARGRFPWFAGIDEMFRQMVIAVKPYLLPLEPHLNRVNPWDDPGGAGDLQRILLLEPSLAGLQFLKQPDQQADLAIAFRGLGRMYLLRFVSKSDPGRGEDFERALQYFTLSLDRANTPFLAWNDIGMLYSYGSAKLGQPDAHQMLAIQAWRASAQSHPGQQRAYYNLGTLDLNSGNFEQALQLFDTALRHPNWEVSPDAELRSAVKYNRACAISRLAERDSEPGLSKLEEARADLLACLAEGHSFVLDGFKDDCKPGKDLDHLLKKYPTLRAEIIAKLGDLS